MNTIKITAIVILLPIFLIFTNCEDGGDDDEGISQATITGTVYDELGNPLSNIKISTNSECEGVEFDPHITFTNSTGQYSVIQTFSGNCNDGYVNFLLNDPAGVFKPLTEGDHVTYTPYVKNFILEAY